MPLPPGPVGLKFWQPRVENIEAGWSPLYAQALTSNGGGYTNNTLRQRIAVAAYDSGAPATGTQLRVTVQGASGTAAVWSKAYIGHAATSGDAYDFDGTQVQLLFSGVAGGSVPAGSVSLTSDPVTYAFDKTKPLVISLFCNTGDFRTTNTGANFNHYTKSGGDDAITTDATGYSTIANNLTAFSRVEVYSAPIGDSGPVTLPADGGSYTLTGAATGLGLGYWLTGTDVAFVTAPVGGGTTLTADAGGYVLTGSAAASGVPDDAHGRGRQLCPDRLGDRPGAGPPGSPARTLRSQPRSLAARR